METIGLRNNKTAYGSSGRHEVIFVLLEPNRLIFLEANDTLIDVRSYRATADFVSWIGVV